LLIINLTNKDNMARTKSEAYDYQLKLLTLGDSAVGKTCGLLRYCNDTFSSTFITTIGIDFKIKTILLDGKKIKLQVWDTAGQERFRTITESYYRGAHGIVLMYDITNRATFNNVKEWMRSIDEHAKGTTVILVGNKCDLEDRRDVTRIEGEALAKKYKLQFFETSAKKGIGLKEAFEAIALEIYTKLTINESVKKSKQVDSTIVNIVPDPIIKRRGCC
jgi:Ras-related protein Rab-8A